MSKKIVRTPLLRVGSAKRLTKGTTSGIVPEEGLKPYAGG